MRPTLYIAALSAKGSNSVFKLFFERLVGENGKTKLCAVVAVMRKIIVVANARIRDAIAKQKDFQGLQAAI